MKMNEAMDLLEREEDVNSNVWQNLDQDLMNRHNNVEILHRALTQCCNRLVRSGRSDERFTIPIAIRCASALTKFGEINQVQYVRIVSHIVFRYPYRLAVMMDPENTSFDSFRELIARASPSRSLEDAYGIVLLTCRGVCVLDNMIESLSWITYATTRVYNIFRNMRMDHLSIAIRVLSLTRLRLRRENGGVQLCMVAACTALIENMTNRPEASFLRSEIESIQGIIRSTLPLNSRVLLGMAILKVQHPIKEDDDGYDLFLATLLQIILNMRSDESALYNIEIKTHVLDTNTASIKPAYLARLVVNLSTKIFSEFVSRARCIRFMFEWLRTISIPSTTTTTTLHLDQTYVLSILILDEITNHVVEIDSRLAADLVRELTRLEILASNLDTERALGQRREDLMKRLIRCVSSSSSFLRMCSTIPRKDISNTTLRLTRIWIEEAALSERLEQLYDEGPLRDLVIPRFLSSLGKNLEFSSEIHLAFQVLLGNGPKSLRERLVDELEEEEEVVENAIDFGVPLNLRSRLEILSSYLNATLSEFPKILSSKQVAAVCGGVFRSISGHTDKERAASLHCTDLVGQRLRVLIRTEQRNPWPLPRFLGIRNLGEETEEPWRTLVVVLFHALKLIHINNVPSMWDIIMTHLEAISSECDRGVYKEVIKSAFEILTSDIGRSRNMFLMPHLLRLRDRADRYVG